MQTTSENSMKGWPYSDFSSGWYQIGYSKDIEPGVVEAATWLNQELVIFRTESGQLGVLDAYCKHMGAHLGHAGKFGGCVKGEAVQCPWHGWEWDVNGKNVYIPYLDTLSKSTIESKHVREIDGLIMMWYDYKGREPWYEWSGLPYRKAKEDHYPIDTQVVGPCRIKPQFPIENSADLHHFPYVHGSAMSASFTDYEYEGGHHIKNVMSLLFGGGKESTWLTPNGPVEGTIHNYFWGASLGVCRFEIDDRHCIHMTNVTPINHNESMFFSTIAHSKEPGDDTDTPKGIAKKMIEAQHVQISHDFHIWENQKYLTKPIFQGGEETRYAELRRWLDSHYPEEDRVYAQNRTVDKVVG